MNEPTIATEWRADAGVLATRLTGPATIAQVEAWKRGLYQAAARIPGNGSFRMLIDIRGYEVADVAPEVHRVQRLIVPTFLLEHGFRIAFFDLFEDATEPQVERRGPTCTAMANVHHDCAKMELYRERIGRADQGFFCDIVEAEEWLAGV